MAVTEKSLKNLKSTKKGDVLNPNGRPKGSQNTKTILERFLNAEIKTTNPLTEKEEKMSIYEIINAVLVQNAMQGDIASYREVVDKFEGKVVQKNESTINFDTETPPKIEFIKT